MRPTLTEIVENKKIEVKQRKLTTPLATLEHQLQPGRGNFVTVLESRAINLIAELKPRSPSAGVLREAQHLDVQELIRLYSKYAAAISVLTDACYFGGSVALLEQVAGATETPILCKDFIIDRYQIYEARAAGAEAVLLIAKILSEEQMADLQACAEELNIKAVIEVQREAELTRALAISPAVILINNRDLDSYTIDLQTTATLTSLIPPAIPVISASGIDNAQDVSRLLKYTNRFLVGSSIMKSGDVEAKLAELCGVSSKCTG
jgi:indole-3-glycerol phosphate synthase